MDCDNEFLNRLQMGEPAAYEELVVQLEGPLYRYFLGSCGDPQQAGEQSSDCFAELFKAIPKMTGGTEQIRPFIFGVARNVARRHRRGRQREAATLEEPDRIVSSTPSPEQTLELREDLARLLTAVQSLDDITRDVFLLRFVDQLSLAEVAAVVNEPLGTIKSRIHRGRQRLESILKPKSISYD